MDRAGNGRLGGHVLGFGGHPDLRPQSRRIPEVAAHHTRIRHIVARAGHPGHAVRRFVRRHALRAGLHDRRRQVGLQDRRSHLLLSRPDRKGRRSAADRRGFHGRIVVLLGPRRKPTVDLRHWGSDPKFTRGRAATCGRRTADRLRRRRQRAPGRGQRQRWRPAVGVRHHVDRTDACHPQPTQLLARAGAEGHLSGKPGRCHLVRPLRLLPAPGHRSTLCLQRLAR